MVPRHFLGVAAQLQGTQRTTLPNTCTGSKGQRTLGSSDDSRDFGKIYVCRRSSEVPIFGGADVPKEEGFLFPQFPRPFRVFLFGGMIALRLAGTAQSQHTVPRAVHGAAPTLEAYLLSNASDELLLGTKNFYALGGGEWNCRQEPVEWFSLSVVPVFRERIERPLSPPSVEVRVLDATVEVPEGDARRRSKAGEVMASLLAKASIEGLNVLSWTETADGWELTGDITLSLGVTPPRILPIPRRIFERVYAFALWPALPQ